MRRSRMTQTERWELGFFMGLMVAGCLLLTAVMNLDGLPRIFAWASSGQPDNDGVGTTWVEDAVPILEVPDLDNVVVELPGDLPSTAGPSVRTPAPRVTPSVDVRSYAGKRYRYVKTIRMRVTAYAPDPRCTWPYPGTTTASGLSVKTNGGRLVAADTRVIPMHSLVVVPGYAGGTGVPVLDRGGAIKGNRLDILLPTFEKAKAWGVKVLDVRIYREIK